MTAAARFGQLLQEARQRRELSPEQLAVETNIPLGHLEALEAGLLHAVPGGLYRRAEVRAYAEAVGLDPTVVLNALKRALEPAEVGEAPSTHATVPFSSLSEVPPEPRYASNVLPLRPRAYWRVAAVLVLGGAALLYEQAGGAPTRSELPELAAADVTLQAATILDDVRRFAEPLPLAPALSRTLFASYAAPTARHAGNGQLGSGRLIVQSTPAGARVTVNGVGWGVTPVTIRHLPLGTMRVRLLKESYRAQEREVKLTADTPTRNLDVRLPQIPGGRALTSASSGPMLVVNTTPPGARVTINGIGWGNTPVAIAHLPAGPQRLRVVKDRFISEERVVELREGQPRRIAIDLRPVRRR
jgi:hypothetical protein